MTDKGLPIRIAPVRGRLPRRYQVVDEPTRRQKWRWRGLLCLACAAFWGGVYWVANR